MRIREKNRVLNAAGVWGAVITLPQRVQGRAMLGDQENVTFNAQKAIDWLIIYSFLT